MENQLNALVQRLREVVGKELSAVVLYGSRAGGVFEPEYSDVNLLCVLKRLDAEVLERLNPVAKWWKKKGHPAPLLLGEEELGRSADVFVIEYLDIKHNHRVLFGQDPFAQLQIPVTLHRTQVEFELRTKLIRLRQAYLEAAADRGSLLNLMLSSLSSFLTLFRHALMVIGEEPPAEKQALVDRVGEWTGADMGVFHQLLDIRAGKLRAHNWDVTDAARQYLVAVLRVIEEVDRSRHGCIAATPEGEA